MVYFKRSGLEALEPEHSQCRACEAPDPLALCGAVARAPRGAHGRAHCTDDVEGALRETAHDTPEVEALPRPSFAYAHTTVSLVERGV